MQRRIYVDVVAVGKWREYLGYHAHLYVVGDAQFALDALLVGSGGLEFLDIVNERVLHVAEGMAEQGNLVVALAHRYLVVEIAMGYDICRACELFERMHTGADDEYAHHHHEEYSHSHHDDEQPLESVVAAEDVAFGTNDADAPSHALEWSIENVGVVASCDILATNRHHASLAACHEFAHMANLGESAFESLGEDCLATYY